jgi:toxic protein SymE
VGFATGANVSLKITYGFIVIMLANKEVDTLKQQQEVLSPQLREIFLANENIKFLL